MKSIFLVCIAWLICSHSGLAQTHLEPYNQGRKLLGNGQYVDAVEQLKSAVSINPQFQDGWYYLGLAANYAGMYEQGATAFLKLESLNPNYTPWFYYEAANALIALGRFDDAIYCARQFVAKQPAGPNTENMRHLGRNREYYAQKSPEIRSSPILMKSPIPLSGINSPSGDYTPQINPTGTRLYFTSVRKGGYDRQDDPANRPNDWGEDVYYSDLENGTWSAARLMPPPINGIGDDFGSAFTGDGQTMVYVRCGDKNGVGNCDLYITQKEGNTWGEPVNMGNVVNSKDWDSQPTISADGTRIIFASAREGGYGGADLYMTEKNHLGLWGIPQNLGSIINTPLNDNSPYLAPDGKTLYYSTNGHPGFGGADIFYSLFENGKWSAPVNVGAPLNSSGDDTNFSISASGTAFFASSRTADGNYDLFEIELPDHLKPKPTVVLQGIVRSAKTEAPLGAWLVIEDLTTGEMIAANKSNSLTGEYLVVLPAGRDYSVSANADGFFFFSKSFEIPKESSYQEITMNMELEPIEKGTKVVLNNIFFETGKAAIKPISYVELAKAVELLKNNAKMKVEIGGHTDNVGSDEVNLRLSQERANAVMQYLIQAGISSARLTAKGYGKSQPIADNATETGRATNRRTEFTIQEF